MKAGVAAMVMAAVAARRARIPLRGDVLVAGVVGELQGGVGTVHLLRTGVRADAAIVPEPYGTENILTKHTGVAEFAVHVIGRSAHISRVSRGVNAISKMTKVIHALETLELRGNRIPISPTCPSASWEASSEDAAGRGSSAGPTSSRTSAPCSWTSASRRA